MKSHPYHVKLLRFFQKLHRMAAFVGDGGIPGDWTDVGGFVSLSSEDQTSHCGMWIHVSLSAKHWLYEAAITVIANAEPGHTETLAFLNASSKVLSYCGCCTFENSCKRVDVFMSHDKYGLQAVCLLRCCVSFATSVLPMQRHDCER